MSPESPPPGGPEGPESSEVEKKDVSTPTSGEARERAGERRRFRRYRMSMPVWLSYGRNFREVESGLVRNISKSGIFMVTEGGKDLSAGDLVKVNATFTVRGEARVVRVREEEEGPRGIALQFTQKLDLDI